MEASFLNMLDTGTQEFVQDLESELEQDIGVKIDNSKSTLACGEKNFQPRI